MTAPQHEAPSSWGAPEPQHEAPSSWGAPEPQHEAPVVGLLGAGHMGAGLGWALREGGARVLTTLAGRSERTARLVAAAGLETTADLDALVRQSTHILVVTPPAAALAAARDLASAAARTGARPLVADMNAIAPVTVAEVEDALGPLDLVDGSISGGPPTVAPGARLYFSGPRAAEMIGLPWKHVRPVLVAGGTGAASALKMSTASVYKGMVGLYAQAMRSAAHYGVLDEFIADSRASGFDLAASVALAATKAERYVPEMRQISFAQRGAGLTPALFEAFAEMYAQLATSALAARDPESADLSLTPAEIVSGISRPAEA